jgi:hypothetical protein
MSRDVLLIEDDNDLAALVRLHLQDLGCAVTTVADGAAGLTAVLERGPWSLVVLDLGLPRVDGLEICRRLRLSGPTESTMLIGHPWCFHTGSFSMHFWMTILFSALLGLMIYLIAALDNPYRGKISVSPEPLERVFQQVMTSGN